MRRDGATQPWDSPATDGQRSVCSGRVRRQSAVRPAAGARRLRIDTKAILIVLPANAVFFGYGMLAYTGGEHQRRQRAGVLLFMVLMTTAMIGRWIRRRI